MSNNTKQTTFWQFLQKQPIEIPIIQRDYAQGRSGKEKLRGKFLADLKSALDGKLLNDETTLILDFVYGSVENSNLNPLDGQQRLTTLWLLYWYIAYKADTLKENADTFKRFTYETRVSSRAFCKKLSEFTEQPPTDTKIKKHIQNQTWFFSVWKQDPTIQAMLNMLGGTPHKNEKNEDIVDGIEELFGELTKETYTGYWETLTGNCPIKFYYLPLHDYGLSDDLYIKMNARGKPLTSFENFKADLVGHIKDKIEDEKWYNNQKETYEKFVFGFTNKLDTTWTDIFWKNKSEENKIDDIYFAFLNRYFLNALITSKKGNDYLFKGEDWDKNNKTFQHLSQEKEYSSFDIYNPKEKDEEVFQWSAYENLTNTLNSFHCAFKDKTPKEINSVFLPNWGDDKFKFIPEYEKNQKHDENKNKSEFISTTITQPLRVIFYAICCYFENSAYNETSFKQWMRVVWNIVENASIESTQSMIGAIRLIDELGKYSHDIYAHLKDRDITKDAANEQMKEEKEKAHQIIDNPTENWEEKIIKAENTAFFKGAVRFMFTKEDGSYDWSLFDDRFVKSVEYFDKNGVKDDYKKDALLLRVLISEFSEWSHFTDIHYDNNIFTWKNDLLISKKQIKAVSKMFDEIDIESINLTNFTSSLIDKIKDFQEDLVKTHVLSKIESGCTFHWLNYGGKYSLYPYNTKSQWKIYVFADRRNGILSKLIADNVITSEQIIKNAPYFWGWEIYFRCNDKEYQWWDILKEKDDNGEWKEIEGVTIDNLDSFLLNK
jgi:hypothetical protein